MPRSKRRNELDQYNQTPQTIDTNGRPQGRSPRKRSGFLIVGGLITLVAMGVLALFFRINSPNNQTETTASVTTTREVTGLADSQVPSRPSEEKTPPRHSQSSSTTTLPAKEGASLFTATGADEQGDFSFQENLLSTQNVAPVEVPEGEDVVVTGGVRLPLRPYSIYVGAYKELEESETTERELLSNYLPAYIVPVDIQGSVAQSLFGVSQDGIWYRIMVGNFTSKEDARETLGRMMKERPEGQPEIMRFDYAVECGRFLDDEQAGKLTAELIQKNFFPYEQTYPTTDGRILTRILVGCHFSEQGARSEKNVLEEKGVSCKIVQR